MQNTVLINPVSQVTDHSGDATTVSVEQGSVFVEVRDQCLPLSEDPEYALGCYTAEQARALAAALLAAADKLEEQA
jgi:hypothetical protein